MSLTRALYEYLTNQEPIAGPSGQPFSSAQAVGNTLVTDRVDARQRLRSLVGDAIFENRTPQEVEQLLTRKDYHTVLVLQFDAATFEYALDSEARFVESGMQCVVYALDPGGRDRAALVTGYLRLAVSGFRNGTWGATHIDSCLLEDQRSFPIAPIDASDRWIFVSTIDLQVFDDAAVANQWPS